MSRYRPSEHCIKKCVVHSAWKGIFKNYSVRYNARSPDPQQCEHWVYIHIVNDFISWLLFDARGLSQFSRFSGSASPIKENLQFHTRTKKPGFAKESSMNTYSNVYFSSSGSNASKQVHCLGHYTYQKANIRAPINWRLSDTDLTRVALNERTLSSPFPRNVLNFDRTVHRHSVR